MEYEMIHRHTGGLENLQRHLFQTVRIHRHTGGLEIMQVHATQ